jgi:hypothetical protein
MWIAAINQLIRDRDDGSVSNADNRHSCNTPPARGSLGVAEQESHGEGGRRVRGGQHLG